MCVLFTEDVGGILTLEFDEDGNLLFRTEAAEADARFDEIADELSVYSGPVYSVLLPFVRMAQTLAQKYDVVVTNPPYVRASGPMISGRKEVALARHEIEGGLSDFLDAASVLLRNHGTLCMVHRPARLAEIITEASARHLETKEILPVAPREGRDPNLLLIRFVKNGGQGTALRAPLYVYEGDGYSDRILELYERERG